MKIAIVDDLKSDRDILNEKLNQYAKCNNIKYELTDFSSAEEFLEDFEVGKFQIVLEISYEKSNTFQKTLCSVNCLYSVGSYADSLLFQC